MMEWLTTMSGGEMATLFVGGTIMLFFRPERSRRRVVCTILGGLSR